MAPTFDTSVTIVDNTTATYTYTCSGYYRVKPVESKKDKIARIAKENMLASHKTYNQKTPTVKHLKQVCKPVHRIRTFR